MLNQRLFEFMLVIFKNLIKFLYLLIDVMIAEVIQSELDPSDQLIFLF